MTQVKELVIKVVAMPADTNPDGNMFGGWIISQMDLAAYLFARKFARSNVVTVAMENIAFHRPVYVGDCLLCYASLEKTGRTSLTVRVDAMVERMNSSAEEQVTEGHFVLVAINKDGTPSPITYSQ